MVVKSGGWGIWLRIVVVKTHQIQCLFYTRSIQRHTWDGTIVIINLYTTKVPGIQVGGFPDCAR